MKVGDSSTKTGPQALQPYEVIGGYSYMLVSDEVSNRDTTPSKIKISGDNQRVRG